MTAAVSVPRLHALTIYTRPLRLKWQVDPAWRKPTGQRSRRSITATATSRTVQRRNDRQGHRFIVETCDLRSVRSIRASAHLHYRDRAIAYCDREIIHQPKRLRRIYPKEATSENHVRDKTCVGLLVLAQTYSSTEEALCRRRSALSGQGVVSHDHYRASGTRSATAAESIRNTNQNVRTP